MKLTLKIKFFLLLLFALGLATIPAAYVASDSLRRYALESGRKSFYNFSVLMEENILQRYMILQKFESLGVSSSKDSLLSVARFTDELWRIYSADKQHANNQALLGALIKQLQHNDVIFDVYGLGAVTTPGKSVVKSFQLQTPLFKELARDMARTDFKGDSLGDMLSMPIDEGVFAVFRLEGSEWNNIRGDMPDVGDAVMILFYPLGGEVLCLARKLPGMDLWPEHREEEILRQLHSELRRINRSKNVSVNVLNKGGALLISTSEKGEFDAGCIPLTVLADARKQKIVEFIEHDNAHGEEQHAYAHDSAGTLYRVAYIRTLDWFLVTTVGISSLEASGKELARQMVMMGLGAAGISLLGMLLLAQRFTAPLRELVQRARKLAVTDFSRSDALAEDAKEKQRKKALVRRGDEVGELATAFAHMETALHDNIHHLVDVTRAKERMQGELDAARNIQRGMLAPEGEERVHASCALAALLEAAKEVGGDFYDFMLLPDERVAIAIGDVSGKGVPAALFMAMTVSLVRAALLGGMEPAAVLRYANNALCRHNPENMFVTLWVGVLDPVSGVLEYANGGHCPPLLLPASAQEVEARPLLDFVSGPVVGGVDDMAYDGRSLQLNAGDALLLYSDGITEAENDRDDFFGMERLWYCVEQERHIPPRELLTRVEAAVTAFRGAREQSDDITMLCMRWLGPEQGGR